MLTEIDSVLVDSLSPLSLPNLALGDTVSPYPLDSDIDALPIPNSCLVLS